MAKNNSLFLIGSVKWIGYSKKDSAENSQYIICNITVVRKKESIDTGRIKSDQFMLICRDQKMISQIKEFCENDVLQVEGTIETMNIKKTVRCQYCNKQNVTSYPLVYINPTHLAKLVHCNTSEAAMKMLLSMK